MMKIWRNARKLRRRTIAERVIVINAQDCHIIRHLKSDRFRTRQHINANCVIRRKNPKWTRRGLQPIAQHLAIAYRSIYRTMRVKGKTNSTGIPYALIKCIPTVIAPIDWTSKRNIAIGGTFKRLEYLCGGMGDCYGIACNANSITNSVMVKKNRRQISELMNIYLKMHGCTVNNSPCRIPEIHQPPYVPFGRIRRTVSVENRSGICAKFSMDAPVGRLRVASKALQLREIALAKAGLEIEDGLHAFFMDKA